jgi:hypothetical protein
LATSAHHRPSAAAPLPTLHQVVRRASPAARRHAASPGAFSRYVRGWQALEHAADEGPSCRLQHDAQRGRNLATSCWPSAARFSSPASCRQVNLDRYSAGRCFDERAHVGECFKYMRPGAMGSVARSTLATARPNLVGFWQRFGIALRRPFEPLPHRRAYALPQPLIPSQLVRPLSPVELRWLLVRLLPLFAVEPLPHRRVYGPLLPTPLRFRRPFSPFRFLSALNRLPTSGAR